MTICEKMKLAIIAITKDGSALARRLRDSYPEGADLYLPKKFILPREKGSRVIGDDLASETGRLFAKYKGLVFIMATGIVVRLIAPHLKDKLKDPAVVVMDESGRHVISLLSGHAGGANALAEEIASLTGAEPVITTASDTKGLLAVDTLADRLGFVVEDYAKAKEVTAAIVNGEPVSLYSHIDPDYLVSRVPGLPENLRLYSSLDDLVWSKGSAAIAITPHVIPDDEIKVFGTTAFLRPRVLVVGMGCNRGTTARELSGLFNTTLERHGLSPLSVRNIATVEDKRDEAGLNSFARKMKLEIEYISKDRLLKAATPSGPSDVVYKNMGVYGVCEPAALLSAGAKVLLVQKRKSKNATIAVAEAGLS